jgi:peptidoglycan/LPS O-acetylase OafA/YrhL
MTDSRRYYALDALRGVMMMLGIVLHASIFYIAYPPLPFPTDSHTSVVFDAIVLFIHSFRMPLFFVLAGFFTSLLVEKYGMGGSYENRAKRILAPFVLGLFTFVPLTAWAAVSMLVSAQTGERQLVVSLVQLEALDFSAMEAAGMRPDPSPAHLWFLYFLLFFYLLIPVLMWANRRLEGTRLDAACRRFVGSALALPVFGLWTALTLIPFRGGLVFEGFTYFVPEFDALLYYGSFFVLGWFFHRWRGVLEVFRDTVRTTGLAACVLFPIGALLGERVLAGDQSTVVQAGAVLANGLATWALIYAVTGLFLRYLDSPSPWSLYISQSSYWVYLLHMPVVSFCAWYLLELNVPAGVKFAIDVTLTTVLCFASYHYLVRRSWVSVLLCGKRFDLDWPWRRPSAAAA